MLLSSGLYAGLCEGNSTAPVSSSTVLCTEQSVQLNFVFQCAVATNTFLAFPMGRLQCLLVTQSQFVAVVSWFLMQSQCISQAPCQQCWAGEAQG